MTRIKKVSKPNPGSSIVLLGSKKTNWEKWGLTNEEAAFIKKRLDNDKKYVALNHLNSWVYVITPESKNEIGVNIFEQCRRCGNTITLLANDQKIKELTIIDTENKNGYALAVAEGMALGNYQFLKYRKSIAKETNSLETISVQSAKVNSKDLETLEIVVEANHIARTLVNEPLSYLTAEKLAQEISTIAKSCGSKVEVFDKKKIESLKMGGILAVNRGSQDPPTFSIMEWKPKNAKNKKPYVLVGKGVVYDTGGLSLKPTANSMDKMKSDMAGAAAVVCAHYAIAKAKLPVHVITLVPATDNRPGENAYTPGDVVTMYNGLTVEVLNTDAEGRMLLGDALSYASKYDPLLVMDFATLTGAAMMAIGQYGTVVVGTADEKTKNRLKESGYNTHERLAEFPFWDEYGDLVKSELAEIKNVGGPTAGAITAGKFLSHFVNYPWMHFDIAGPSFIDNRNGYLTKGGTGVGVRLLFDFFKNVTKK